MSRTSAVVLLCSAVLLSSRARALELPAVCAGSAATADTTTPIPVLRRKVEAESETDPTAAEQLICATIPRVEKEYGETSAELGWWVKALTMPMIAYQDQFEQALPLLAFARRLLERAYGPDGEQLADIYVAYAWIYQRQGKYAAAAHEWLRALAVRERFPGAQKIELQKVLVGLALARLKQGRLRAARFAIGRAHDILVEDHAEVSEAGAAIENIRTNIAVREERFAEAKRHAQAQLAIERQLKLNVAQLVPAYVLLGKILERLDDFAGSEAASREAIRLAEAQHGGPLQKHHLEALTQLAALLNARGRSREALPYAQRAVALGEQTLGPDAPHLVEVLQTLADAYRAMGELPEAWHVYQRMGAIVRKNERHIDRPALVTYYRRLAGLELELGNVDDAVSALEAGLKAAHAEPRLVLQRAYLVATLAQISARSNYRRSRAQFREARRLFESRLPGSHPAILRVINESCALETEVDAPPVDCREALRRLTSGSEIQPALRAAIYENLSALSQRHGHLEVAALYADSAVAAVEGLGTPGTLWKAYFRNAEVLEASGQSALAIFFGKLAITEIERERHRFTGEDERFDSGFLRDKSGVYRAVADWLLDAGRVDEAIEVMRLLKAHEFAQFVSRAAPVGAHGPGPELDPAERALQQRYRHMLPNRSPAGEEIARLSGMQDQGRLTSSERERLLALARAQLQQEAGTARRIRRFLERNRNRQTAPVAVGTAQAAVLQEEIARAPAHAAIAYYLLTDHRLRVLIATHSSQSEVIVPVDAGRLRRTIGTFLDQITGRQDTDATARELYATLAEPLDERARREGITRLYLWLDGTLRYVPFGALLGPEGYLTDHYVIERVAYGGTPATLASQAPAGPLTVRGFGVTRAVAGFPALPAVAEELCYIVRGPIVGLASTPRVCLQSPAQRGALAGEGFADADFTEQRLERSLSSPHAFSVLHLGTHFSLRPGNIDRSFLVLGDGSHLTLEALSVLDFSGLDLVTLSACQTAVDGGRTDDGREVEGLSAIVQKGGARHVVASLWQVDDVSTADLMRAMYDGLEDPGGDVAAALRRAQRTVRELTVNGAQPYAQPYYWAGFVVSGDFR